MRFEDLQAKRDAIYAVADKYGVTNIRVFGSVARGDADETSDVDVMIAMKKPSLFKLGGFKVSMEELLSCRVDVVEEEDWRAGMKARIVEQARLL
jgi:uncharacterized protein